MICMASLYPKEDAIGNPYEILTGMTDQGKKAIAAAASIEFGPFQLQSDGRVYKYGHPVPLSPKERAVLRLLVTAEGRIVAKDEILQTVWGEADVSESSLTRCIHALRHRLGEDRRDRPYIRTVYGQGYCLDLPVRRVTAHLPQRHAPLQNPRLVRAAQTVPQAYEAYLEAHYLFRRRNANRMNQAIELFHLAIQWDPNYAQAYVGLAGCYGQLMGWTAMTTSQALPLVKQALDRAEAIDPTTPGLQVLRAAMLSAAEGKFAIADQIFKTALSEATADVESLLYYGRHLLVSGQSAAALDVFQTVLELDPLSPLSYGIYSYALHCARRPDAALQMIDRGLKLEPDAVILLFFQCLLKAYAGLDDEALATGQRILKLSPPLPGIISIYAYVCACAGLQQEALQYIEQARNRNSFPGKSLMAPAFIALGDHDSAIAWLEQAFVEADIWLALVSLDPRIDAIRSHPHVQQIIHQIGTIEHIR